MGILITELPLKPLTTSIPPASNMPEGEKPRAMFGNCAWAAPAPARHQQVETSVNTELKTVLRKDVTLHLGAGTTGASPLGPPARSRSELMLAYGTRRRCSRRCSPSGSARLPPCQKTRV